MNPRANLLSAEQVKSELENEFSTAQQIIIISAYITMPAVDWLITSISRNCQHVDVFIVARVTPVDVISGSTSLKALRACLDRGYNVYILHSLHAKIYLVDKKTMYVGSSNFTSNGLKIFGEGNLEALLQVMPNDKDMEFIDNILRVSIQIDIASLTKMEDFVASYEQKPGDEIPYKWPVYISPSTDGLWVSDFPLLRLGDYVNSNDSHNEFSRILLTQKTAEKKELLRKTRIYSWLIDTLRSEESYECYYGKLSKIIHDALQDDPAPYRKDVKQLLSNLLEFIEMVSLEEIVVDRPNHSQRLRLIENSK
ncbi:MAG: phospholipase D family protein [Actinobacteria bacterium]|nr:phospholipase D family protein [Actinomycetota bacterium]